MSEEETKAAQTPVPAEDAAAGAPNTAKKHSVFEKDKYGRARMHISNLGHRTAQEDAHKYYNRSWLTPFFGANVPEPWESFPREVHPCDLLNVEVHSCLERKQNDFAYCQPKVADYQRCLRKFNM